MNTTSIIDTPPQIATDIPPLDKDEAAQLASVELERVLYVLEQLQGEDWKQPTDCTAWNIRDMTAHLAGACAGWAGWRDFRRQILLNPHMRHMDVPVDAINRRQLEDRVGKSPQELLQELREVGPRAIRNRRNLPGLFRRIRIDAKPLPGKMTMGYLVDVIYPRDQWMHRMDICRATGKTLVTTPEHDGRLLDLVMLDMAKRLAKRYAVIVNVTGALSTSYRFGQGNPQAEIDIDFLTLNRRSSARINVAETLPTTQIRDDEAVAQNFLQDCEVLY